MDFLPTEVLSHIFSYLKPCDRLKTSLVSKRWLEANDCLELLKDIPLTIRNIYDFPDQLSRRFSSFKFRNHDLDPEFLVVLWRLQTQLHSISVANCDPTRELDCFDGDIDYLNNLKILEISHCHALNLFSSLPQLVELHLYTELSLTDEMLMRFKNTMLNLKVFYLSRDFICFDKIYKRFYPNEADVETNPSTMVLSFPAIKLFIRKRSRTLQALGFDHTSISAAALKEISMIENLQLQKISLMNCGECGKGLEDLFRNQTQLKEVNLSGVREILSDAVKAMCLLPYLRKINVSGSPFITRFSAERIFQLPKLEEVDLSKCKDITPDGFDLATSQLKTFKLRSLNLSSCRIGCKTISTIISLCRDLSFLDLSDCDVNDQNVNEMSRMLSHLTYLRLSRCSGITDSALTGYSKEETEIDEDEDLFGDSIQNPSQPLSNIKGLQKLYLNECHQITLVGIMYGLKVKHLQELDIRGCSVSADAVHMLRMKNQALAVIYE